jgi:hypothetical protein
VGPGSLTISDRHEFIWLGLVNRRYCEYPILEKHMPNAVSAKAKLTTLATFPENYFLENLAVRDNNSVLVTAFNHKELWYVQPGLEQARRRLLQCCLLHH